jgi:tetratricopeptide (TPR) repeat protein
MYIDAMLAGERSLGDQFFKHNTGHFWAIHETRPYMRAMETWGIHSRRIGLPDKAREIYLKMLKLNPGDNQGIRYNLICVLIEMNLDAEAEKLYKNYKDDYSAWWVYSRALLDFRKTGDSKKARESLKKAVEYNPFVPQYFLGQKKVPPIPPPYYGVGDANEAMMYYDDAKPAWENTPNAIKWLAEQIR